jgi:protein YibB
MLTEAFNKVKFDLFWDGSPDALHRNTDIIKSDDISIVTAFFDIGRHAWGNSNRIDQRHKRNVDVYLSYFSNLSKIKNQIIIFIDENLAQKVLDIRKAYGLADKTVIFTSKHFFLADEILKITQRIQEIMNGKFHDYVWTKSSPEYNEPKYVLVNTFKSFFAAYAIEKKIVTSPQVAWIDFGYCRDNDRFDSNIPWRFNAQNKMNLFYILTLNDEPIFTIVKEGDVYFQGGHLIGDLSNWLDFRREIDISLSSLMDCGFIDDDQTLILMAYRRNPSSYIIHPVDSKDWFVIFKYFNSSTLTPLTEVRKKRKRRSPIWWKEFKVWLSQNSK